MTIVQLEPAGKVGLVVDQPTSQLPAIAWDQLVNARPRDGRLVRVGGETQVFGTPLATPVWMMYFPTAAARWWLYASLTKLYAYDMTNGAHYDITPVGTTFSAESIHRWQGTSIGGIPVINNGVDDPQVWTPAVSTTDVTALPNWPAGYKAQVIRAYKNFLVALDVTKAGGTRYQQMVKWSHSADPGTVPSSWDETDATLDAGEVELAETPDALVDCLQLRDVNILYKENTVWGMQHVAGSSFIFRFYRLFAEGAGLLATECAQPFRNGQMHFVVGNDDVYVHNGQEARSVANSRVRRTLFNAIDGTYYKRTFVLPLYRESEMWVCIPEQGTATGDPTMAWVWNWKDDTWHQRELPPLGFGAAGVVVDVAAGDTWDASTGTWDSGTAPWDGFIERALNGLVSTGGVFKKVDSGESTRRVRLRRSGLAFAGQRFDGTLTTDLTTVKLVRRVWLEIEGTGSAPLDIYVGTQDTYSDGITWNGPYQYTIGTSKYVDCLVAGRILSVRIEEPAGFTGSWTMSGFALDVVGAGRY